MGELKRRISISNVNVTLGGKPNENPFLGKHYPCLTCGDPLEIRPTKKGKPYWKCDQCGNQTFIRGKLGIARLIRMVESGNLPIGNKIELLSSTVLFNKIAQLRLQKAELAGNKGFIFDDPDLKNALRAIDNEIEGKQIELAKLGKKSVQGKNR
jgi:hypothetical protein